MILETPSARDSLIGKLGQSLPAAAPDLTRWTKVVSERLGHPTASVTLDTCSHAIPAMQEEAAVRIAELMFAETQGERSAEIRLHAASDEKRTLPVPAGSSS